MNIPFFDLKKQYNNIKIEINQGIQDVLNDCRFIMGPNVKAFEEEIADCLNVKHAVGVANGTDALLLSLHACEIGEGDQVITSPFTFFATSEVISQRKAVPVFVDIDPETYCIDTKLIKDKITSKTRAIMPVHIFGQTANMDEIVKMAKEYGLFVIEDACQAIGAGFKGRNAGTIGDTGCFSFFPTKNLGGFGDGGLIVTNNDRLAQDIRILRVHGGSPKYYHSMIGCNSRLDEIQAAVLRVKLKYLDDYNKKRRDIAARYNSAFEGLPVRLPLEGVDTYHVYHLYMLMVENREKMMDYLKKQGIGTGLYYPVPLHLQDVYIDLGYKKGDMPVSEKYSDTMFALPCYPELSMDEQFYVIEKVKAYFK